MKLVAGTGYSSTLHEMIMGHLPYFVLHIDPIVHKARFREQKLTDYQIKVIMLLYHRGSSTPGHISRLLNIQKGSLTGVLKFLRGSGMIIREKIDGNERSYKVTITDKGRLFVSQHLSECDRRLGELFADMNEADREAVITGLNTINSYLEIGGEKNERS